MRLASSLLLSCFVAGCAVETVETSTQGPAGAEPPMMGVMYTQEVSATRAKERKFHGFADMFAHGGPIMTTATTGAVLWGTSWPSYTGDKITGIDAWYEGFGGSDYASTILAEVCKVLAEAASDPTNPVKLDPSGNGYYAVYSDVKRGNADYCAWHSSGTCGGTRVQFGFFFDLDGDPGCDPGDTSGMHSQGLAALANVSGHELCEARTDPELNAWYDLFGNECADKCAWTFGAPLVPFSNGTHWKIQGEWSNHAYDTGTGYPNSSGQRGCLSGL